MNKDEIIKLALKAGFSYDAAIDHIFSIDGYTEVGVTSGIERFAALVAKYEREQCAKVCENLYYGLRIQPTRSECAYAIRSRK